MDRFVDVDVGVMLSYSRLNGGLVMGRQLIYAKIGGLIPEI